MGQKRKATRLRARSDRSDRGFKDSRVELSMILRNAAGQESERSLTFLTLEDPDESVGDKSLILFDSPRISQARHSCRTQRSWTQMINGFTCQPSNE